MPTWEAAVGSEAPATSFLQRAAVQPPRLLPMRPATYAEVVAGCPPHLACAELVFVRRRGASTPLAPQYDSPFRVVARGPKSFQLQMGDRIDVVSVDRLKPFLGSSATPALPPRRRRPPGSGTASGSTLEGVMWRIGEAEAAIL